MSIIVKVTGLFSHIFFLILAVGGEWWWYVVVHF